MKKNRHTIHATFWVCFAFSTTGYVTAKSYFVVHHDSERQREIPLRFAVGRLHEGRGPHAAGEIKIAVAGAVHDGVGAQ